MASQNLIIAAHAMGLGTCYNGIFMGAYNQEQCIQRYFGLNEAFKMQMFIMLGYPKAGIKYCHIIERKKPDVLWMD